MNERAVAFIQTNERENKPRMRGLTEIRGPYYTPIGGRYLEDVLETMGAYIDSLKFAGGSFALTPRAVLKEMIDLAHRHEVKVSTGEFKQAQTTSSNILKIGKFKKKSTNCNYGQPGGCP
jgi:phosphosulfolactate synthase (CoM biosynthesis protein A)